MVRSLSPGLPKLLLPSFVLFWCQVGGVGVGPFDALPNIGVCYYVLNFIDGTTIWVIRSLENQTVSVKSIFIGNKVGRIFKNSH